MYSDSEECGYDLNFVGDIPEYLKCIVCHLILRNPVQIMVCGHRYCNPCYERIKSYSTHFKSDLCCPIDREVIDPVKVFKDTGIARAINDLMVKCSFETDGCTWSGELRDIKTHETKCIYGLKESHKIEIKDDNVDLTTTLLNQLSERLVKCELGLLEKDKDLAYVKLHLHETKQKVKVKEDEITLLKTHNVEIEKEIKLLKESNRQLNDYVQGEINATKNIVDFGKKEYDLFKKDMVLIKKNQDENNEEIKKLTLNLKEIEKKGKQNPSESSKDKKTGNNDDLNIWKDEVDRTLYRINYDCDKVFSELDGLRAHINNFGNLLPYEKNITLGCPVFVWRIHNFHSHSDKRETLDSPYFYSHPDGNLCKLQVEWKDEGNLGVFLRICHRPNTTEESNAAIFKKTIRLQVLSADSKRQISRIVKGFADGKKQPGSPGSGYSKFIKKDELDDFVVNDTICISCTLIE